MLPQVSVWGFVPFEWMCVCFGVRSVSGCQWGVYWVCGVLGSGGDFFRCVVLVCVWLKSVYPYRVCVSQCACV